MLILILRTFILYILVIICMRLMGKQQISQLQPFEFVAALMIAELATIPMENVGTPLYDGIAPVITILTLQTVTGFLTLKSAGFRRLISGSPSVIIKDGHILEKELSKSRYNLNDLLEQLRIKDCPNLDEVAFAILETNGELSVIPKAAYNKVTPKDLQLSYAPKTVYPSVLILDGRIQTDSLKELNISEHDLLTRLTSFKIHSVKETLIAILDTEGNLFAQKKERR